MPVYTSVTLACECCYAMFYGESILDAELIGWYVVGRCACCPVCMEAGAEPEVQPNIIREERPCSA